jgi:hypothetical protein
MNPERTLILGVQQHHVRLRVEWFVNVVDFGHKFSSKHKISP